MQMIAAAGADPFPIAEDLGSITEQMTGVAADHVRFAGC
jgi:hypothetical protein